MKKVSTSTIEWLETRFEKKESGIIIDDDDFGSFDAIHDFLELKEHSYKTRAIYYSAFATESPAEFMSTLAEELSSKLGIYREKSCRTLAEKIAASELQIVIIDRSYIHSAETTEGLMTWLGQHGVSVILVGSKIEMNRVQFLNRPYLMQLDRCVANARFCAATASC